MNLAIVGPRSPIAQSFINTIEKLDQSQKWQLSFYHKSDLSPLIEFNKREIPVLSFNLEKIKKLAPQAILFFPEEDYREEILAAEHLNSKIIDATGSLIGESTIPLVMPSINQDLLNKHNLVSLPSYKTAIFAPLIHALDKRFSVRRVSILCQDIKGPGDFFLNNDYCTEETNTINEISKILDNDSLRLTVADIEKSISTSYNYYINISMAKPFNTEELLGQIKNTASILSRKDSSELDLDQDLILRRHWRDLSLDSGINLWISTKNPHRPLVMAIINTLESIKAG